MARLSPLRSNWFKWALLALLLLAIALGVARALNKRKTLNEAASQAAAALQKASVYELTAQDVIRVQPLELQQAVAVSGALKAQQTVQLKARVAGELQGLSKREGDAVHVGEVLARIDSTEALARVRQAEQQAQAARAQVTIAQRTQDNNQSLVKQGFISATALDTSSANLAAAEANHRAVLAALDIARKGLADTTLRSPIQGQVSARLAQNGERMALDGRILELVDLSGFELEAALAPADAVGVRPGQPSRLTVEGLAQPVTAEVARINPSVQAASRSVLVYLRVPPLPGMRQGLFAQGQIEIARLRAPAVPLSAVRNDKPEPYLQWLQDGKVVHRPVSLARQARWNDEPMVVLGEAAQAMQGALVLSARAGAIREGTEVRLIAAPAGAAADAPAAAASAAAAVADVPAAAAAATVVPAAAAAGTTATPAPASH